MNKNESYFRDFKSQDVVLMCLNIFLFQVSYYELSNIFFPIMSFKIRGKIQFLSNIKFH